MSLWAKLFGSGTKKSNSMADSAKLQSPGGRTLPTKSDGHDPLIAVTSRKAEMSDETGLQSIDLESELRKLQLGIVKAAGPFPDAESVREAVSSGEAVGPNQIRELPDFSSLLRAFHQGDPSLGIVAADALGRLKHPAAIHSLIQALADKNEYVQRHACSALVRLGTVCIDSLILVLKFGPLMGRVYAASALGSIGDARAITPLRDALADDHMLVRRNAGKSLEALGVKWDSGEVVSVPREEPAEKAMMWPQGWCLVQDDEAQNESEFGMVCSVIEEARKARSKQGWNVGFEVASFQKPQGGNYPYQVLIGVSHTTNGQFGEELNVVLKEIIARCKNMPESMTPAGFRQFIEYYRPIVLKRKRFQPEL